MKNLTMFFDRFTISLMTVVILAFFLPTPPSLLPFLNYFVYFAIAFLFFLHGLKLSRESLVSGLTNWPVHLLILACTFVMFPLLGLLLKPLLVFLAGPKLYMGLLFLCALPSTVQSSIAFTSMARGNVAVAICSASISSLIGIIITPLLISLLFSAEHGGFSLDSLKKLCLQMLIPFLVGHFSRPWLYSHLEKQKKIIGFVDRGSILLIVYSAFSQAINQGLWNNITLISLGGLIICCLIILSLALVFSNKLSKLLGFKRPEQLAITFCGSKKSLAAGIPMANILFSPTLASSLILPLMIFHQIQLIACSIIASHAARKHPEDSKKDEGY